MNAARALLVALSLIAFQPQPVLSDPDLTAAVNLAFFPRTETSELHELAHQRAYEVSQPGGWCHCGQREGTAEVLASTTGGPERAVEQWIASPDHNVILSDPTFSLIGCGSHAANGTTYYACVLTAAPAQQAPIQPVEGRDSSVGRAPERPEVAGSTPVPGPLPDTRMP